MNGPVVTAGGGDIPSLRYRLGELQGMTVEQRIQLFVELAIERCGSAAALARELSVAAPTVSEWRTGRKKPTAVKLIRIQDLAHSLESTEQTWNQS